LKSKAVFAKDIRTGDRVSEVFLAAEKNLGLLPERGPLFGICGSGTDRRVGRQGLGTMPWPGTRPFKKGDLKPRPGTGAEL
jgi:hypothetical protein